MNENITEEQIQELRDHAPFNFVVMDKDFQPVCWENGNPIIYGSLEDIGEENYHCGSDTGILSVDRYCQLFNKRVEEVMEY